jgi:hypothetical protein
MDDRKCDVRVWTGLNWLKIGSNGGSYEHGNEPLFSIKGGEFIDQLRDCKLIKRVY